MAGNISALLLEGFQTAYKSGLYTDLAITCGSDRYNVHKVIVCPNVEFFRLALQFSGTEGQTDCIDLPEDEPAIIKLVIQYLYDGEYDPRLSVRNKYEQLKAYANSPETMVRISTSPHTCNPSYSNRGNVKELCANVHVCPHHKCGRQCEMKCRDFMCSKCITMAMEFEHKKYANGPEDLLVHAKLYAVAEKYGVAGLKHLARLKFALTCNLFWDSPDFAIAARYVHTSTVDTDKDLRDIVHDVICAHVIIVKKGDIANLIEDFGLWNSIFLTKMEANGWK